MESIREYFEEVETTKEYDGYYYQVGDIVSIVVLGSLCGLKNLNQLHQWAKNEGTREFLRKEFKIERIPCYYWFLCLLKMVKPDSLSRCLMRWAEEQLPENRKGVTVSLDGKTVRSTGKMDSYESPLHVVSAQLCELGITFGSKSVEGKSNEIPAVQELLRELEISGCMVVADALQCQKRRQKQLLMEKETICLAYKATRKPWRQISQTMCRTLIYEKIWTQTSKKRKTGVGLRSEQHLSPTMSEGFPTGRRGQACAALARSIRSLKKRERKPVNGITISPAEN